MSSDDGDNPNDPIWYRLVKLLLHHLVAITAFVTAITALGLNCNTRVVQQEHGEKIGQNQQSIQQIEQKADVAQDKAAVAEKKAEALERKVDKDK